MYDDRALTRDDILRYADPFPGAPLYCHARLEGSTNHSARDLARSGAPHGTVVIADSQTGGEGRYGRPFFSPPGRGIYISVVVRPHRWAPARIPLLTINTAAAVSDAIEQVAGRRPAVKWVNDLFLAGRKVCGILATVSAPGTPGIAPEPVSWAVVGVGINVNGYEFPYPLSETAGSLQMCLGRPFDRALMTARVLTALADMFSATEAELEGYLERYRSGCLTVGRDVTVTWQGQCRQARAVAVADDGSLLVRFPDGTRHPIRSGECHLQIQ